MQNEWELFRIQKLLLEATKIMGSHSTTSNWHRILKLWHQRVFFYMISIIRKKNNRNWTKHYGGRISQCKMFPSICMSNIFFSCALSAPTPTLLQSSIPWDVASSSIGLVLHLALLMPLLILLSGLFYSWIQFHILYPASLGCLFSCSCEDPDSCLHAVVPNDPRL